MDARNGPYLITIYKHLRNVPLICIIYTYVRVQRIAKMYLYRAKFSKKVGLSSICDRNNEL